MDVSRIHTASLTAVLVAFFIASGDAFIFASSFSRDACKRLDIFLHDRVVGQDLAIDQFVDAVCAHLADGTRRQQGQGRSTPLVISLHGPPGVGKSLTHGLAALALYGMDGSIASFEGDFWSIVMEFIARMRNSRGCPGKGCPGYKVLYGLDYLKNEGRQQRQLLRDAIIGVTRTFPDSLIVVEEYDRMDCDTRSMLRQLFHHPELAHVNLGRTIFLMVSNRGMFELQDLLREAGGRDKVTAEKSHHKLKDLMFDYWREKNCESYYETLNSVNSIDLFIPYFNLEKQHLREIIEKRLWEVAGSVRDIQLSWDQHVVDFLLDRIEFDGKHPVDGARDVASSLRYVSRALRQLRLHEKGWGDLISDCDQVPRVVLKASMVNNKMWAILKH